MISIKHTISVILLTVMLSCNKQPNSNISSQEQNTTKQVNEFAIIIHGGAGTILKANLTNEKEEEYREKLTQAVQAGYQILKNGGSSGDAVIASIQIMEESPLFNAGKGAVFTHDGKNELDASFMNGKTLEAGAVAGVTNVKSPIELARTIMTNSKHVMLSGKGASVFAKEQGLTIVDPSYFYTESRYNALQKIIEKEKTQLDSEKQLSNYYDDDIRNSKFGTVGCVALDKEGNISAGTSTGGMSNKKWNRIGDTPIIGSGTYANNKTCGVSSTGWGEYFIRNQVAYDISAQIEYKGISLQQATLDVIQNKLTKLGGTGGVIALDKYGNMQYEFNTAGMYRASINDKGELDVQIFK